MRQLFQHGPGGASMDRRVETGVPVIAGYRRRDHPQGRGPRAGPRPVFQVCRHIFGRGGQRTSPRRLRPRDEAVPLTNVAVPSPRPS